MHREPGDLSKLADIDRRPPLEASPSGLTTADGVGLSFLIFTLVAWFLHVSVGWGNETMTGHEFRQAQTALSIQAVARDGMRLDYSTPVLGKPWSIPMEFPLYQWGAAGWATMTGSEVVQAGRFVSVFAFCLGLLAVGLILRRVGLSWGAGFGVLAVLIATPVYAFYSAAVLIESTAWCASAWFLWGVLSYRRSAAWGHLLLAVVAGAVAVLVKPTTWAVACLPWAFLWLADGVRLRTAGNWRPWLLQAGVLGAGLLALGYGWVSYADHVKAQNPVAHFLISSELTGFNFGTWGMKIDPSTWELLAQHWHRDIVSPLVLAGGLLISLVGRQTRMLAMLGVVAFGGIQLIFTNLYVAHDYYLYANAAYLVVAFSIGLAFWWDRPGAVWQSKLPAGLGIVILTASQFHLYRSELFQDILERPAQESKLPGLIRELTDPDDVIVGHMGDWNPWLAFHAQRRMLMIPDAQMFFHAAKVDQNIALLADESVPLMLVEGEASRQPRWVTQRILQLDLHAVPLLVWNHAITVFARFDRYAEMAARVREIELAEISVPEDDRMVSPQLLPVLSALVQEQISPALDVIPIAGNFPHGVIVADIEGSKALLVHAPTELLFTVPADSRSVTVSYVVPSNVYAERDFDGLMVRFELWDSTARPVSLSRDWISPEEGHAPRNLVLALPEGDSRQLLLRVGAGPFNRPAFDQAWLKTLHFSAEDSAQTTSAK